MLLKLVLSDPFNEERKLSSSNSCLLFLFTKSHAALWLFSKVKTDSDDCPIYCHKKITCITLGIFFCPSSLSVCAAL